MQGSEGDTAVGDLPASAQQGVLLRLAALAPKPKLGRPLNGAYAWFGQARGAEEVRHSCKNETRQMVDI